MHKDTNNHQGDQSQPLPCQFIIRKHNQICETNIKSKLSCQWGLNHPLLKATAFAGCVKATQVYFNHTIYRSFISLSKKYIKWTNTHSHTNSVLLITVKAKSVQVNNPAGWPTNNLWPLLPCQTPLINCSCSAEFLHVLKASMIRFVGTRRPLVNLLLMQIKLILDVMIGCG